MNKRQKKKHVMRRVSKAYDLSLKINSRHGSVFIATIKDFRGNQHLLTGVTNSIEKRHEYGKLDEVSIEGFLNEV